MPTLQASTSYGDYLQANPTLSQESSDVQAKVAAGWFDKHVATQPGFSQEDPKVQATVRQSFFKKYNVPELRPSYTPDPIKIINPNLGGGALGQNIHDFTQRLGNVGLAGINAIESPIKQLDQAPGAFKAEAQQFMKDPNAGAGAYAGAMGGALGGLRSLAQIPSDIVGGLHSAWTGQQQAPLYNLPDVKDIPFAGKTLDEQMQKHPVFSTVGNLVGQAAGGDLLAHGLGAIGKRLPAFRKASPKAPTIKVRAPGAAYGDFGASVAKRVDGQILTQSRQIARDTRAFIADANKHQGIDQAATARERMAALKNAHDQYEEMAKTANPTTKAAIRKAQADLQAAHAENNTRALRAEANAEARARAQEANARVRQRQEYLKGRVKELAEQEKASQAAQRQMEAEGRDLQNLKDRQAVKDQLALERAESKNRQRELRQFKGEIKANAKQADLQAAQNAASDKALNHAEKEEQQRSARRLQGAIKERLNEQKAIEKTKSPETQSEPAAQPQGESKGKEVKQSQADKLKQVKIAIDKQQGLNLEYEAEKTGETGAYRFKHVSPYEVGINKNGVVQVRAVNDEGQLRTYLLGDQSGSQIISAKATGTPSVHEAVPHPETGKLIARTREGIEITQVKKAGVKSSIIKASLDKMRAVLESKKPSVHEIMEASKGLDTEELDAAMEEVPTETLNELCKGFE